MIFFLIRTYDSVGRFLLSLTNVVSASFPAIGVQIMHGIDHGTERLRPCSPPTSTATEPSITATSEVSKPRESYISPRSSQSRRWLAKGITGGTRSPNASKAHRSSMSRRRGADRLNATAGVFDLCACSRSGFHVSISRRSRPVEPSRAARTPLRRTAGCAVRAAALSGTSHVLVSQPCRDAGYTWAFGPVYSGVTVTAPWHPWRLPTHP
jgi:hypothetical protein